MKYSTTARALTSLCLVCALLLVLSAPAFATAQEISLSPPSLSAKSAVLIDACDRSVLYEKNAGEPMGMASTTKIMTALVIAELLPLDMTVAIPAEAVNTEGSSVYLCEGELLTVRELLCALLLASANDAAVALSIAAAGSVEGFAEKMNRKAEALGLCDTHFVNPHGLYDDAHYTTAYELAVISAAALENPAVREIVATKKVTIPQGVTQECPEGETLRYLQNHNKLLSLYDGAIGVKTGFTKRTGRCLVSAAERDGLTLIAVTLNAPDDWNDHRAMLNYGYSLYERVTLFGVGEFTHSYGVAGGVEQYVTLTNSQPITLTLPKSAGNARCTVSSPQRFEFAPLKAGEVLATLTVTVGNKTATSPLITAFGVERAKKK